MNWNYPTFDDYDKAVSMANSCAAENRCHYSVVADRCGNYSVWPECERKAHEAARLKARCEALIAALKGVKSTSRRTLCWCDHSHDVLKHGHQTKCHRALWAIKKSDF